MPPSTSWQETVAPDEEARFNRYTEQLMEISRKHEGKGRALHRKQHVGLRARVEVIDGLPADARQGLFARAGTHDAWIRLSNGGPGRASDKRPDVRGFALRVMTEGPGALGGPTQAQCFLMINTSTFAFPNMEQFIGVVIAAERGPIAILRQLMRYHGFFGGLKRARHLDKGIKRPFAGFARETFHTAAPIAWGAYAAKVRIVPVDAAEEPRADRAEWAKDIKARIKAGPLRWELQAQLFEDDKSTPIEDPTVEWTVPCVTVARVEAPAQDPDSSDGVKLADEIDRGQFDPWQALIEHRPLGEIMRARKVAYFASQRAREAP
jgi:hypothetical protein